MMFPMATAAAAVPVVGVVAVSCGRGSAANILFLCEWRNFMKSGRAGI